MRRHLYKTKYNWTTEDYDLMLWLQNGRCPICKEHHTLFDRHLDIDHNHRTGRVRGLLCSGCNYVVGRYDNNILKDTELIEKIEDYLCFTLEI